jgi:hypothetical protein
MPAGAILRYELGGLLTNWLVRVWFVATIVLTLLILAANWASSTTAPMLQALLFPYLIFPWFLVVMVLGISPVTGSRLDSLADGILSRPITRHEYLLAAWAARVLVVLAVYLLVMVPVVLLAVYARRDVAQDMVTAYGVLSTLTVVGVIQMFLVTLGFLVGTLLRRPLLATVVLIFAWMPVNWVFSTFDLEQFSPWTMYVAVPSLLRTPWETAELDEEQTSTQMAEDAAALEAQAEQFGRWLTGQSPAPVRRPRQDGLFEPRDFPNLSVPRILAGYGLPTLAALLLSLVVFHRRDL